jgi:hypothetical protein
MTIADHTFTILSVDWDNDLTVVSAKLEPSALDEEEVSPFRRNWELWGGKIYDSAE